MEMLNDNKLYKQAREFWEKFVKVTGISWDAYYLQIKDQMNIYYSLPDSDKRKFLDTRMMLLGKAERAIQKVKEEHYNKGNKK